jgi:hypothetical protein
MIDRDRRDSRPSSSEHSACRRAPADAEWSSAGARESVRSPAVTLLLLLLLLPPRAFAAALGRSAAALDHFSQQRDTTATARASARRQMGARRTSAAHAANLQPASRQAREKGRQAQGTAPALANVEA